TLPVSMSQTRTGLSAAASFLPSPENARLAARRAVRNRPTFLPEATSKTTTASAALGAVSETARANSAPDGEKVSAGANAEPPSICRIGLPLPTSQRRTLPSELTAARVAASGAKAVFVKRRLLFGRPSRTRYAPVERSQRQIDETAVSSLYAVWIV